MARAAPHGTQTTPNVQKGKVTQAVTMHKNFPQLNLWSFFGGVGVCVSMEHYEYRGLLLWAHRPETLGKSSPTT